MASTLVDRGAEEWVHLAARCVMHREFASHQVVVEGAGRGAERDHRAIWMVGEEPGHGDASWRETAQGQLLGGRVSGEVRAEQGRLVA